MPKSIDFDLETDMKIFDDLFEKRPEISPESLRKDLENYYLPYLQKLVEIKNFIESHNINESTDLIAIVLRLIQAIQKPPKHPIEKEEALNLKNLLQYIEDPAYNIWGINIKITKDNISHNISLTDSKVMEEMRKQITLQSEHYDTLVYLSEFRNIRVLNDKKKYDIQVYLELENLKFYLRNVEGLTEDAELKIVTGYFFSFLKLVGSIDKFNNEINPEANYRYSSYDSYLQDRMGTIFKRSQEALNKFYSPYDNRL